MELRVITLRFDDGLNGFPEEPLRRATAGRDVHAVREYFFVHGGVPHLALVLTLAGDAGVARPAQKRAGPDPMMGLPPERRKLYLELKRWRNGQAEMDGVPPFVVMRNELLAEVSRRAPHSLAALKEIAGVGEKTVSKYGTGLLSCVPEGLAPLVDDVKPTAPSVAEAPPGRPRREILRRLLDADRSAGEPALRHARRGARQTRPGSRPQIPGERGERALPVAA